MNRFGKTLCITFFFLIVSPLYAQSSKGDCSPNGKILINNVFICSESLTEKERLELASIKRSLESIASQRPVAARQIRLELLRISDMSQGHFEALQELNSDISRKIEKLSVQTDMLRMRVDTLLMLAYQAPIDSFIEEESELEGKPRLLYIPTPSYKKTFAQLVADSDCKKINVSNAIVNDNEKLSKLVLKTESMDCEEKQYWFDILPSMTDIQINRLYEILDTEVQKLAALEKKYIKEMKCLNNRHLFEWKTFKKKKGGGKIDKGGALNAAVDYMYEGCELDWSKVDDADKQDTIKQIAFYLKDAIGSSELYGYNYQGALALSKLYKTEKHKNYGKEKYWAYTAYRSAESKWDAFELYIKLLMDKKEYKEAYQVVSNAIAQGKMKEIKGDSEKAIVRKLSLYWWHLILSRETRNTGNIDTIAIAGYNLSKMLLEKYPSHNYLRQIVFFSGYLAQNHTKHKKEIGEYLDAISEISEKLYIGGVLTPNEFAMNALNISWYCLFAENYKCSVNIATQGLKADSKYKQHLYTNLAHALVMSGEVDKGRKIYIDRKDVKLDGVPWSEVITDDFNKLAAAGIKSRVFDEVKKEILESDKNDS